jgi:hypothetical protein
MSNKRLKAFIETYAPIWGIMEEAFNLKGFKEFQKKKEE